MNISYDQKKFTFKLLHIILSLKNFKPENFMHPVSTQKSESPKTSDHHQKCTEKALSSANKQLLKTINHHLSERSLSSSEIAARVQFANTVTRNQRTDVFLKVYRECMNQNSSNS